MNLYRTKNKTEHLSVCYYSKKKTLRLACRGYSLHIKRANFFAAIKWLLIIVGTLLLFRWGQAFAYAERGYSAYGGEYYLLLLPLLWKLFEINIRDIRANRHRGALGGDGIKEKAGTTFQRFIR